MLFNCRRYCRAARPTKMALANQCPTVFPMTVNKFRDLICLFLWEQTESIPSAEFIINFRKDNVVKLQPQDVRRLIFQWWKLCSKIADTDKRRVRRKGLVCQPLSGLDWDINWRDQKWPVVLQSTDIFHEAIIPAMLMHPWAILLLRKRTGRNALFRRFGMGQQVHRICYIFAAICVFCIEFNRDFATVTFMVKWSWKILLLIDNR